MPDLDESVESESHDQSSSGKSEKMDAPGKNGGLAPLIGLVVIVGLMLFFIFKPDPDELADDVDGLQEEEVETIDDSRSKRPKLDIPKPEKEKSLKDQLKERKQEREDIVEPVVSVEPIKVVKSTRDDRSSMMQELLFAERERKKQEAKEQKKREERLQARMRAGMDANVGAHSWEGGSSSGRGSSEKQVLLEKRRKAQELQNKILMGGVPGTNAKGGLFSTGGSSEKTDGTLLNLPTSSTKLVEAVSLEGTDYLVTEGTVIQASLESAINSNLPGKIRAIVNSPVYSYSGNAKLIDSTSELIGQYRAASEGGDPRIFVIWTRLITSDGISVQLDSPGIDALGRSGASGWVDTHFFKRFGASVMLSIIGGVTQAEADDSLQSQAVSDSFNRSAEIALERSINIKPTVKLNQGQRIAVFVNQDISFEGALKQRRIARLEAQRDQEPSISYDRVFDETPLSIEERALLGNRFIRDRKSVLMESNIQKPYTAEAGESLRAVFANWGRRGRYTVHWLVKDDEGNELDWRMASDVSMHGTLHHVVNKLTEAYKRAGVPLAYQFFKGNRVLEIRLSEGATL